MPVVKAHRRPDSASRCSNLNLKPQAYNGYYGYCGLGMQVQSALSGVYTAFKLLITGSRAQVKHVILTNAFASLSSLNQQIDPWHCL